MTTSAEVHPYAASVIEAELGRLDQCRNVPLGHAPGWDDTTYEVACNLVEIANSPWSNYNLEQAWRDFSARAPRDPGFTDARVTAKWESARGKVGATGRPEPSGVTLTPPPVTVLDLDAGDEADFWESRDILTHLHQFARARIVSPWAVLGATLARVVTATPFDLGLPPIVGTRASLNLFVGLVGPSGSGKGAAEGVAAEALSVGHLVSHNVGSGEGIGHGYMRRVKGALEWLDDKHAVLFSVPEIDAFAALGDRKGATLLPQLRSAWSGEQLGFGYADPTKRIIVPRHEYRMCLVAGIQPGRSRALLDDADGGTPQRFLWLPATDADIPDSEPECPQPRTWTPPPLGSLASVGGRNMSVCEQARQTVLEARRARARGDGDALDGHALLTRLKTAAALALLERRTSVTEEDWQLSGLIMRKSDATRERCRQALASQVKAANEARALGEADRAVLVAERTADAAVKRVCGVIVRKLRREGDWTPRSGLRRTLPARDREHFEVALERLVEAGQIEAQAIQHHGQRGEKYRQIGDGK